ncbi:uncharacterized protein LOC134681728 isoform X2 [Mytilus trossulus]|uniref:uncharacterized protein LOC134681728 isoform X2 n=1 Tax=Mytilus trossulus TaxID=6551 RepID=UPI0030042BC8
MKERTLFHLCVFVFTTTQYLTVESCDTDQFQCTNGQCIPAKARCDDNFECSDYSDELNCIFVQPCPEALYRCETGQCVDNKAKCTSSESVMPSPSSFVDDQLVSTVTAYIPSQSSYHQATQMPTSTEISEKLHSSSTLLDAINYTPSLKQTTIWTDSFTSYITASKPSHTASKTFLQLYSTQSTTLNVSPESNLQPRKSGTSQVSLSSLEPSTTVDQLSNIISSNTDQRTTTQTYIKSNFIASSMTIEASKSMHFETSELDITTNHHSFLFVNFSSMVSSKPLQSVNSTPLTYLSTKSFLHTSGDMSMFSASERSVHTSLYTTLPPNKFTSRDVQSILPPLTSSEQQRTSTPLNGLLETTSSSTEHPTIKTTPSFESTVPEDKRDNGTAFPYWVIVIIVVVTLIVMTTLYIIYRHYVRKRTRKKEFGSITSMDMVHPDIVPKDTKHKFHGGMIQTSSFNRVHQYH